MFYHMNNQATDALLDPEFRKQVQGLKDVTAAMIGGTSSPVVFSIDQESKLKRKVIKNTQGKDIDLAGVPSDQLKVDVLDRVYELNGIKILGDFRFLVAKHLKTNVGIFVVDGNFGRDHFKKAISEAKVAGLNTSRMYVYGQTATYSGAGICFCKFDELGLSISAPPASN